ncbi:MAG: large conductance mechanosensitive channel protein MscL [Oscillospiraceae bacterium]|nr:large conductance mechanosensitive channel protein MscL [Oscillospiraceae bacterium]
MEKKGLLAEFKDFLAQGNALDLAVGVVIGGAFNAVVTAIVEAFINPIIGAINGGIDFSDWKLGLFPVGELIMAVLNFIIVAFVLFVIVRTANAAKAKANAAKIAEEKKKAEEEEAAKKAAEEEAAKKAEEPVELLRQILEAVKK